MFTERSLDFQKSQICPYLHLSLPRPALFAPPAVRRRWTSSTARPRPNGPGETSPRHLARPLAPPRAHTRPRPLPSRHDTPAGAAPLPPPPARRRATQDQINRPQSLHSSPRSSLAYKDPQNPHSRAPSSPSSSSRRSAMAAEIQLSRTG